jgi:hypothetical protein
MPADNMAPAAPAAPMAPADNTLLHCQQVSRDGRRGFPGALLDFSPADRQEALDSPAAGVVTIFRFSCSCPSVDQSDPGGVQVSWNL